LITVGSKLSHLPIVTNTVTGIDQRWKDSSKVLLGNEKQLEYVADIWQEYVQTQQELQLTLVNAGKKLADSDSNIVSVDVQKLQSQQDNYQVSAFF